MAEINYSPTTIIFSTHVVAENKLVGKNRTGCIDESLASRALDLAEQASVCMPHSETEAGLSVFHPDDEVPLRVASRRRHLNKKLIFLRSPRVDLHSPVLLEFGQRVEQSYGKQS